jgi:hypothetical protein
MLRRTAMIAILRRNDRGCLPFLTVCTVLMATTSSAAAAQGAADAPAQSRNRVGAGGVVGCLENPKEVERLLIAKPGTYENYLVDSHWAGGNRVKITADGVTLRHCEIRDAAGNGVGVFADNVFIESWRTTSAI